MQKAHSTPLLSDFAELDSIFIGPEFAFHCLTFPSGEFSQVFNNIAGSVVWWKEGGEFAA